MSAKPEAVIKMAEAGQKKEDTSWVPPKDQLALMEADFVPRKRPRRTTPDTLIVVEPAEATEEIATTTPRSVATDPIQMHQAAVMAAVAEPQTSAEKTTPTVVPAVELSHSAISAVTAIPTVKTTPSVWSQLQHAWKVRNESRAWRTAVAVGKYTAMTIGIIGLLTACIAMPEVAMVALAWTGVGVSAWAVVQKAWGSRLSQAGGKSPMKRSVKLGLMTTAVGLGIAAAILPPLKIATMAIAFVGVALTGVLLLYKKIMDSRKAQQKKQDEADQRLVMGTEALSAAVRQELHHTHSSSAEITDELKSGRPSTGVLPSRESSSDDWDDDELAELGSRRHSPVNSPSTATRHSDDETGSDTDGEEKPLEPRV